MLSEQQTAYTLYCVVNALRNQDSACSIYCLSTLLNILTNRQYFGHALRRVDSIKNGQYVDHVISGINSMFPEFEQPHTRLLVDQIDGTQGYIQSQGLSTIISRQIHEIYIVLRFSGSRFSKSSKVLQAMMIRG